MHASPHSPPHYFFLELPSSSSGPGRVSPSYDCFQEPHEPLGDRIKGLLLSYIEPGGKKIQGRLATGRAPNKQEGPIGYMGRPRGKSKKAIEATSNDDEDGRSGEEVPPALKRRGRPLKLLNKDDDADEAEDKDAAEVDEDAESTKPVVRRPIKDSKKRRRRRLKRSPDESVEEEDEEGHVRSKSNGFRPNGSRRKSTPRRAAEAGVECQ